jgi:hypothetical protein
MLDDLFFGALWVSTLDAGKQYADCQQPLVQHKRGEGGKVSQQSRPRLLRLSPSIGGTDPNAKCRRKPSVVRQYFHSGACCVAGRSNRGFGGVGAPA